MKNDLALAVNTFSFIFSIDCKLDWIPAWDTGFRYRLKIEYYWE